MIVHALKTILLALCCWWLAWEFTRNMKGDE